MELDVNVKSPLHHLAQAPIGQEPERLVNNVQSTRMGIVSAFVSIMSPTMLFQKLLMGAVERRPATEIFVPTVASGLLALSSMAN